MGQVSWVRAGIAIIFLSVSFGVVGLIDSKALRIEYPESLRDVPLVKPSWIYGAEIPIEQNIITALDLDDYLYRQFLSAAESISLYIGFYHSAEKIGAAHDPLVCFQGQGWVVSNRESGEILLEDSSHQVRYSSMVATNGEHKEYVLYWFQSFDETGYSTHEQKLKMIYKKLTGQGTSNAFVRITTSLRGGTLDEAHERSVHFVQAFYPQFHKYVIRKKE